MHCILCIVLHYISKLYSMHRIKAIVFTALCYMYCSLCIVFYTLNSAVLHYTHFILQGVSRELTKSIGLLHSPKSIPRPIIGWEKLCDVRTF